MPFDAEMLWRRLERLSACSHLYVAFSGGRDSHVLLHAAAALRDRLPPIHAIHVHHGLLAEADHWVEHCARVCRELAVPLRVERVAVDPTELGVEAAAREARYRVFENLVGPDDALLTAHHMDDQAETLLLRALRGTGSRGLASIPVSRPLGAGRLWRPLLDFRRSELERYARRYGLLWVEDPSNRQVDADRNFFRHRVLPGLEQRFPGAVGGLAATAAQAREDSELLDALAQIDLGVCVAGEALRVDAVATLEPGRRRNLIRYWLRQAGVEPPGRARLSRLDDLLTAAEDRFPALVWRHGSIRRYRGALYRVPPLPPEPEAETALSWDLRGDRPLPLGRLMAEEGGQRGLNTALRGRSDLTIRFRRGGERIRLAGHPHSRPLKKLLQDAALPPWERPFLPLLYVGDTLAAVPGLGVAEEFVAAPGDEALELRWHRVVPGGRI